LTKVTVRKNRVNFEETQEMWAGMGGREKGKEDTRGREADEEKMEKAGERGGEKGKGVVPQGHRVTNKKRV